MNFRNLNNDEVAVLKQNGCLAENWDYILVKQDFQPERIRNVYFSGKNTLGVFNKKTLLEEGESVNCGIYNSTLHNMIVEDNAFIASVQFLSTYRVKTGAIIRNVGTIAISGKTTFGLGAEISVLNEGGGREVMMYDRLSSQIASIMANCRHDPNITKQLKTMIGNYVSNKIFERGFIGTGAEIRDSGVLRNIYVGDYARISHANHLEEVTLANSESDPIYVGSGVIARNVIVLSGSSIDTGALLVNCFVGQGVQIGKQFSAEDSAFFANSEGFHGEAVSLFAGPYSVSHHKSTLLIACMTSFVNFGSGTNQSNHMYKLGPLHQGVLERGVKTGSFSYLPLPMVVGPYTAVIGKHGDQLDASEFPFSYVNESDGKSILTPAMNLITVGTRRDSAKWGKRDRRKDPDRLDNIHFDLFSPYTIEKVLAAMDIMKNLHENSKKGQEFVHYKGIYIKRLLLKTCARYYDMVIKIFMANGLMKQLKGVSSPDAFKKKLSDWKYDPKNLFDKWIDLSGSFLPQAVFDGLLQKIANGDFEQPEELEKALSDIHNNYETYRWAYCASLIEKRFGVSVSDWDANFIAGVLNEGKDQMIKLNNMIYHDSKKEFDPSSKISYGFYGKTEEDFEMVRGTLDGNEFVKGLKKENEDIASEVESLIKAIS